MKITFLQNNDLLIWSLLYGSSISIKVHTLKQKLWVTYKKEYQTMKKDKDEILKDVKNFIPDDNTLYDLLQDTKVFERLSKDTEKHRIKLIKSWDTYKKDINRELNKILKISLPDLKVITLHPAMDQMLSSENIPNIGWGKKKDLENPLLTILSIISTAYLQTLSIEEEEKKKIALAILELAIKDECYIRITGQKAGCENRELMVMKQKIYPYFLMYLGYSLEEVETMVRGRIPSLNNDNLKEFTIVEFIDYMTDLINESREIKRETVEIL